MLPTAYMREQTQAEQRQQRVCYAEHGTDTDDAITAVVEQA